MTDLDERDEDDRFVASVPSLPGCHTDGATIDEALNRAQEAIAVYLEGMEAIGKPVAEEREPYLIASVNVA